MGRYLLYPKIFISLMKVLGCDLTLPLLIYLRISIQYRLIAELSFWPRNKEEVCLGVFYVELEIKAIDRKSVV